MEKPYIILDAPHAHELAKYVNEHIKRGYKVKGGVTAKGSHLFQAMLHPEPLNGKGTNFEENLPEHTV
jgi:hypothetical protein